MCGRGFLPGRCMKEVFPGSKAMCWGCCSTVLWFIPAGSIPMRDVLRAGRVYACALWIISGWQTGNRLGGTIASIAWHACMGVRPELYSSGSLPGGKGVTTCRAIFGDVCIAVSGCLSCFIYTFEIHSLFSEFKSVYLWRY